MPKPAPIEIVGAEGLTLKQFTPDDTQTIFDLIECDQDSLNAFGEGTADKYPTVDSVKRSIEAPDDPTKLRFGIYDQGIMVGSINLTPKDEGVAEVGYWVGGQFVGNSYAAKAVKELALYAFDVLGLEKLIANARADNLASLKTLENSGFRLAEVDNAKKTRGFELYADKDKVSYPPLRVDLDKTDDINRLSP